MPIEIREARTRREMKQFVRFGNKLYEGNEYFCPQLEFDELDTLNPKKNPAFEVCESIYYTAWRDGRMVGRIAGIVNREANQHWGVKKVRFGWFDFVDDPEVSRALLDKVVAWGKSKGMDTLNGPVGFTDFDHQGLLLEGYEYNSPMASLYNYPYYVKHFDDYGLTKESDWIEFRIFPPKDVPERLERIANIVMDKYHLKVDKVRSGKEAIRKYGHQFFDVVDKAYMPLYNYSPLTQRQKEHYTNMYIPLVNYDFATIITNEQDEIVGFGVGMPDISDALRRCRGRLFPGDAGGFSSGPAHELLHCLQDQLLQGLLVHIRSLPIRKRWMHRPRAGSAAPAHPQCPISSAICGTRAPAGDRSAPAGWRCHGSWCPDRTA